MKNACIPDDRLRLLLLGELPEPDAQPLEEHLLACQQCVARTRSLRLEDTLVSALNRPGSGAAAADPEIDKLVERLSDRSHLATHSSLLDETQAPAARSAAGDVSDLVARFEPAKATDELGRLGGFRVLKLLGQGGMGAVFLAEDVQLRRPVALKLLRPAQAANPDAAERFLREARAAAAIRHDHVVTIYQVGQAQGMPFIAQELLEGETLEDRLKREGRIPVGEAIQIGGEIAAGLAAAHERGLLHRDVKPGNIWLEASAVGNALRGVPGGGVDDPFTPPERHRGRSLQVRTKLLDFGLARSQQGDEQLTSSGAILGTPAYMSPEQAQGQPLDARSDLFSLGGVLYRMVTGRLPFPGTDVLSTLRSLAVEEPPPARSLNPQVPRELSELIVELLRKDRQKRPASAANVQSRLAAIASSWGGPLAGPGNPPSKRKWIAAICAGAAAALIALAIFLTVKTPYGEVVVDLGDGVKPGDVQVEVSGNGEVKIADAKSDWRIDVKEGKYNVRVLGGDDRFEIDLRSITVTRRKKRFVKVTVKPQPVTVPPVAPPVAPPIATRAKPFYENDFETADPFWVTDRGIAFRSGRYVVDRPDWQKWFWCGDMPAIDSPDVEVVGRASSGSWGMLAVTDELPFRGVVVCLNSQGEVEAWHFTQPEMDAKSMKDQRLRVVQRPLHSWRPGDLNTLRASIEKDRFSVWVNGEPACDPILLPTALPAMTIKVACHGAPAGGLRCEFESLRVWRAGEGPPVSHKRGSALEFNGKDSYVELPTLKYDGSHPITIEAWATSSASRDKGYSFVVDNVDDTFVDGQYWPAGIGLQQRAPTDGAPNCFGAWVSTDALPTGQNQIVGPPKLWSLQRAAHLALQLKDGTAQFYIDGQLVEDRRLAEPHRASKKHFLIGKRFSGRIREVHVSNVARYAGDFTPKVRVEPDEHTLALYHCEEGAGDVLTDSSGNGHHGKIVNAKWVSGIAGGPPRAVAPFNLDEAKGHQIAWARHLDVPVEYENSLGMKLRLIPPGEFLMGSSADEVAELLRIWDKSDTRGPECIRSGSPQHRVVLTRPIYAGVLEVTQRQYAEIMGSNPSAFSKEGEQRAQLEKHSIADTADFPVDSVSWLDATEFCRKLTIHERLTVGGYRLPSEAEWEFACRAGTSGAFHTGDGESAAVAAGWFGGNSGGRPHAGGELAANAFGLCDMHGNAWEWLLDRRDVSAYGRRTTPAVDPQELTSDTKERVLRGGNWRGIPDIGRSSFRDGRDEFHRHHDYGFRVWLPVDSLIASAKADPRLP